ncbi:MAG TPA: dTDP-4-dehydrorhamnose 3,5-epimerase family protein, partial [Terriglobales bacterium]|nr:dTDP-4-dehydrorhamnose 3,5-epimerase family protein [Terriglobales bacterium]
MPFEIESVHLNEIVVLTAQVYEDARGFFMETFRADRFRELGLPDEFPQDNHSCSNRGVLRGLHFQWDPAMGK